MTIKIIAVVLVLFAWFFGWALVRMGDDRR
jgi:hypothetical protein